MDRYLELAPCKNFNIMDKYVSKFNITINTYKKFNIMYL